STTGAIGARVELEAGGKTQLREVSGGTGYASQSEMRVQFGLGALDHAERLTVRWPSGRVQQFEGAPLAACIDGYARLVEAGALEPGKGAPARRSAALPSRVIALRSAGFDATPRPVAPERLALVTPTGSPAPHRHLQGAAR